MRESQLSFQAVLCHCLFPLFLKLCTPAGKDRGDPGLGPHVCEKVDGRNLLTKESLKLTRPTVITNILDGLLPAGGAAWQPSAFKKWFAKQKVTCDQLGGSGCSDLDGNQVISNTVPSSLSKVLKRHIPNGSELDYVFNLFINDAHPVVKKVVSSVVNDTSDAPVFAEARKLVRGPYYLALSMGREAQWNIMHRHRESLFVQMHGSKGWVLVPGRSMPDKFISEAGNELNEEDEQGRFDQESLCRYSMTCERWAEYWSQPQGFCQRKAAQGSKGIDAVSRYRGYACKLEQGEALFFPNGWWHGTCNLDAWNAGFTLIGKPDARKEL